MNNDNSETTESNEEEFNEMLRDIKKRNMAFEMFLEGYQQGVVDATQKPSSLRDSDRFNEHIHEEFERAWGDQ